MMSHGLDIRHDWQLEEVAVLHVFAKQSQPKAYQTVEYRCSRENLTDSKLPGRGSHPVSSSPARSAATRSACIFTITGRHTTFTDCARQASPTSLCCRTSKFSQAHVASMSVKS